MPTQSVVKLSVRWPSAKTAVLSVKTTGAGAASTTFKNMADDTTVTFPLNVTSAAQPNIYTATPGSYDISFKVNGVEIADGTAAGSATAGAAMVRQFELGQGLVFAPTVRALGTVLLSDVFKDTPGATIAAIDASVIDATYGAQEQAVLTDLRTKFDLLRAALQAQGLIL